jgi:nitrous oxide reductase accessory protein NosL
MLRLILATVLLVTMAVAVPAADKESNTVPGGAKCPVCGMFVAKYPDWTATIRFKDGTTTYYDGPKDMFSHYLDIARYTPGKKQGDVATLTVKEYYNLSPLDARSTFYVTGSDVYGPMGHELVPFRDEKDARSFKIDHKGARILRFNEVSRAVIKTLN